MDLHPFWHDLALLSVLNPSPFPAQIPAQLLRLLEQSGPPEAAGALGLGSPLAVAWFAQHEAELTALTTAMHVAPEQLMTLFDFCPQVGCAFGPVSNNRSSGGSWRRGVGLQGRA